MSSARLKPLATRRLAERAKEALLESIRSGAFRDRYLPSEERLAEQLGVSRTTVREALRSLEELGMVTRQHGIGTSINEHVVRATSLNRIVGFYDLIREAGFEAEIAWTVAARGPAPEEVARRLGETEVGAPLLMIERLFLADGAPAVHLTEHVPEAELVRPVDADAVPDSIFEFADEFCRAPVDHTIVEIVPLVAADEIALKLEVPDGEPLLRLIETHFTSAGAPFVISVIHTVDRLLRFSVVRKRM